MKCSRIRRKFCFIKSVLKVAHLTTIQDMMAVYHE